MLAAAVDNLIAWHDVSIRALGFPTALGRYWWTSPTPAPWIYFTAISRRPLVGRAQRQEAVAELRTHLDDPRGGFQAICASHADLDLAWGSTGLALRSRGLWYARPAGATAVVPSSSWLDAEPDDLVIETVAGPGPLAEYESATTAAFGGLAPVTPGDIHAPGILAGSGLHVLVGRHDTRVVAGAMAQLSAGVIGLYGVGTVPGARGRGYATALTRAALALAPDRPAVLQPSPAAARLYRRLGFDEVGAFTHWG
jgi:Acetyltransferase (GNAT) family